MTLEEAVSIVNQATKLDATLGLYPRYINTALREIQQKRSFFGMQRTIEVTIPAQQEYALLPDTYKEPQRGPHPLRGRTSQEPSGFTQWRLLTKQEVKEVFNAVGGFATGWGGSWGYNWDDAAGRIAYVDYRSEDNAFALYLPGPPQQNLTLHFDVYSFLDDLVNPTDTNWLMQQYPQCVLHRTRALLWEMEDDSPEGEAKAEVAQARFEREFQRASYDDASRRFAGRSVSWSGYGT